MYQKENTYWSGYSLKTSLCRQTYLINDNLSILYILKTKNILFYFCNCYYIKIIIITKVINFALLTTVASDGLKSKLKTILYLCARNIIEVVETTL